MAEPRTIFHVDMDAFFASVEVILNPSLKGKPVVVGGRPDRRGVVSTASYEARAYGIHSAMPMFEAVRRCPHAVFLEGNFEAYKEYSSRVMDILSDISEKVEMVSIDEAYLDVTGKEQKAKDTGKNLRKSVLEKTGLTCSVGIASNKMIAKIASSTAKPNGLYEIPHGMEKAFLAPLPIDKIPGIGPKSAEFFYQEGIKTIGDLQKLPLDQLVFLFGPRGYHYYHIAGGVDNRPVVWEECAPKQVGAETTFETDLSEKEDLLEKLDYVVLKAYKRLLREEMFCRSLTLKMRNSDFRTLSRSFTFPAHTKDYQTLKKAARQLFECSWEEEPLRLIGISFEKLTDSYWQPLLWDWEEQESNPRV